MLLRLKSSATSEGPGYDDLLRGGEASPNGPRWWMPALVHLALEVQDLTPDARQELESWCSHRQDCFYTVVQEETDDHLSLGASSWPLVDERGRLRFSTSTDPIELHAERHQLQEFLDAHRARWRRLDLIGAEGATRPVQLGDTFALRFERPDGDVIRLHREKLHRSLNPTDLYLEPVPGAGEAQATLKLVAITQSPGGGRPRRKRIASTAGQVVDVTWDARQAGKVAQLAAFAGVLGNVAPAPPALPALAALPALPALPALAAEAASDPVVSTPGDDALIAEGLDRQLRAFVAGLNPDETLALDADSAGP